MRKAALFQVLHALLQLLHTLLQLLRKAGGALQRFSEMCCGVQVCYQRLYEGSQGSINALLRLLSYGVQVCVC
jgi:hypothetical protein